MTWQIFHTVVKLQRSHKTCTSGMSFLFNVLNNKFCQVIQLQRTHLISNSATQRRKRSERSCFICGPSETAGYLQISQSRKALASNSHWIKWTTNCLSLPFDFPKPEFFFSRMHFSVIIKYFPFAWFWLMAANYNHVFMDKAAACFSGSLLLRCPK